MKMPNKSIKTDAIYSAAFAHGFAILCAKAASLCRRYWGIVQNGAAMKLNYERKKEKELQLRRELGDHLSAQGIDANDLQAVINHLCQTTINLSPPKEEVVPAALITVNSLSGAGGGRSAKPGNIRLNPKQTVPMRPNMELCMDSKYSGRCLCGEISYSVDVEPIFTGNCHCKDCQRVSGGAFIPAMIFPEGSVAVSGEAKYFESRADSGNMHKRGFCPNCGSRVFAKFNTMPGMLDIAAGTLNDSSNYSPKLNFFVASAAAWDYMNPQLPKKQGAPRG